MPSLPFRSVGGKRKFLLHIWAREEKERKWFKESHQLRTANQPSPLREGEIRLPGSKLVHHQPRSKPKTSPPATGPRPHAFSETVNTAPGFAAIVDTAAVLNALARTPLIRKAGIFLAAFASEKIKLLFLPDVCR